MGEPLLLFVRFFSEQVNILENLLFQIGTNFVQGGICQGLKSKVAGVPHSIILFMLWNLQKLLAEIFRLLPVLVGDAYPERCLNGNIAFPQVAVI